ncbi:hypothetical protein DUNSADRAFT_12049 [Dunaliella salina]|uniref:FUZ/MON1/HPS1 first Longin domain-containing protein n=2 Tax=Dunaliella salina TaxID=3046 RepID=A0ABQ7GC12_DUNSA|nr:hypothetical protein DUNSADRAFT_12049 [Dunaliella salina]|eukprot:KAF5832145.1 hypothetical protein DUNSADRAFT_12049 [Dunaliella salina]
MQQSQQLFTIVDEGGQTLVVRSYGDIQAPSFPTLGLLFSIATFSETSGFEMQSVCTQDVQIMYRRFGSLLFIMATNNLLLHADAVRRKLEAVYDGMLLLFGAELLAVDKPFQLDRLRKALRGCQALDYFLCEDVTLPSILLPGPQEVALPPEDVSELRRALGRASQTASTQQAALLSNGLYLVCTPGWRQLSPRESCLLQVIATHHQPEEDHFSITVHLNAGTSQPCELVASRVTEGSTQ